MQQDDVRRVGMRSSRSSETMDVEEIVVRCFPALYVDGDASVFANQLSP